MDLDDSTIDLSELIFSSHKMPFWMANDIVHDDKQCRNRVIFNSIIAYNAIEIGYEMHQECLC